MCVWMYVCVCAGLVSEMRCDSLIVCMCIIYIERLYMYDWCEVLCACVFVVWYDYSEYELEWCNEW